MEINMMMIALSVKNKEMEKYAKDQFLGMTI